MVSQVEELHVCADSSEDAPEGEGVVGGSTFGQDELVETGPRFPGTICTEPVPGVLDGHGVRDHGARCLGHDLLLPARDGGVLEDVCLHLACPQAPLGV